MLFIYSYQITVDLANHVAFEVGWMQQVDMVLQPLLLSNGKSYRIIDTTHDQSVFFAVLAAS